MRLGANTWIGGGLFAVALAVAVTAPWIALTDPVMDANLLNAELPPSREFPFGTDAQGRDIYSRVVYGAQISLTVGVVSQIANSIIGVTLGLTAVGRLLASLEITPQKPLRRAYERDPQAVAQWVKKDYPRLRRRARAVGATIFFLDEAGFSSEPVLGRTYGLRGQTPEVPTSGQRQKVSAMSALSARGAFWSTVYTGTLNAGRFVEFLGDFRRGRRVKIFLVIDGHPSHRAKLVKDYVQSCRGKLELHFLPPYAPDLNPDEFVWQHAKTNGVAKKPLRRNESLKARVIQDLATIKADKPLVRSFFQATSVVSAAD